MWPVKFVSSLTDRKQHCAAQRPSRAAVTLNLEALEERWLPNGTIAATATPPPSFIQAATALYMDGYAEGVEPFFSPQDIPDSVKASIAYYSPYVGPFAPFFVLAGQMAWLNTRQPSAHDLSSEFLPNSPNGL